ncbi:MAG: hypothetical protein P4M12_12085 [Gammaproteobacteria bacterium]|nr:hypothetical protein [Gammaproteobacteria bacterium]
MKFFKLPFEKKSPNNLRKLLSKITTRRAYILMNLFGIFYQSLCVEAAHSGPRFLLKTKEDGLYLLQLFTTHFIHADLFELKLYRCRDVGLQNYYRIYDDSVFSPANSRLVLINGVAWDFFAKQYEAALYTIQDAYVNDELVDCITKLFPSKPVEGVRIEIVACILMAIALLWLVNHILSHTLFAREPQREIFMDFREELPEQENVPDVLDDPNDKTLFSNRAEVLENKLTELNNSIFLKEEVQTLQGKFEKFIKDNECPVGKLLMDKPVTLSSGIAYNKNSLFGFFKPKENVCPITRKPLLENKKAVLETDVFRNNYIGRKLAKLEQAAAALEEKQQFSLCEEVLGEICDNVARI